MMKQQHHNQQPPMNGNNGDHGGPSPPLPETKWWYKGPDMITYGPYTPREMREWNSTGYFNNALPVKTENDDTFHPIGEWIMIMGGVSPFTNSSVPAFNDFVHRMQAAQQFHLYPPGLPAPAYSSGGANSNGGGGAPSNGARFGGPPPFPPPAAAVEAMMARMNMHGGGGGGHMGMHPMHPSQPNSEPMDGGSGSNSQTPDNSEPDFRSLHQMGSMHPPQQQQPVPTMHPSRIQFGYNMPLQAQALMQQAAHQQHSIGGAALSSSAAPAVSHAPNGVLAFSRVTSTQDAPWNSRREIAIDATQRPPHRATVATQTLPVIIGSKDASRLLSDLTGSQIVIT